jgi:hypothetical protein
MPGTVLVREALRRVSTLLQDIDPQFTNFPESEAVDALNDAQMAVASLLQGAGTRSDAIRLKPGAQQSIETISPLDCRPGDGSIQTTPVYGIAFMGLYRNMGADGFTPGRAITVVDQDKLDAQDPDWALASRARTSLLTYCHNPLLPLVFQVSPPVHATTPVWVQAQFSAQPARIPAGGPVGAEIYRATGANTETIKVRDEFLDLLVHYVVARANMKDAEWTESNKAAYFTNLFLGVVNAKIQAATGVNPNLKRLPLTPALAGAAS